MKQLSAVLLCLLLLGCGRHSPAPPPEPVPEPQSASVMAGMYDPDHPMEKDYPGQIRAYPLTMRKAHGIRAWGTDVLVFSGQGTTTLTVLTGDDLTETASLTLEMHLRQEDPSLQIGEDQLSYYDPEQRATIVLDHQLQELRRIAAPDGLSGKPIFAPETDTLYYCTGWSVVAWDLETGIRRTVKELSYDAQALTGLLADKGILECSIRDSGEARKLYLTADQGLEVKALGDKASITTGSNGYLAQIPGGYQTLLIFGSPEGAPELLLPEQTGERQYYLPEDHAAVTVTASGDGICLDYYELNTGILRTSVILEAHQPPRNIVNSKDHRVYILAYDPEADCDILYRWDVLRRQPDPSNVTSYKSPYHSADDPDLEALAQCRDYANTIGEKYGITVLIWQDAAEHQPWDYRFEPEHLAPVLQKELTLLDSRLAQYPETVLQQTKDHFSGLTICLVRQITGTQDSGSLSTATGIQFFENQNAYVVITVGAYSQQALYHELYHVMETHILTESTALDRWDTLNPAGFVYGTDQQNAEIYLQGETRAFVDRYSMGYLKEDRARVLENALLPGKEEIFRSEYMQRKLHALCLGIREAYDLKNCGEILPWEQYLVNSLVPKK